MTFLVLALTAGTFLAVLAGALQQHISFTALIIFYSVLGLPGAIVFGIRLSQRPVILRDEQNKLVAQAKKAVEQERHQLDAERAEHVAELTKLRIKVQAEHDELQREYDELEAQKRSAAKQQAEYEESISSLQTMTSRATSTLHGHFDTLHELNDSLHALLTVLEKKSSEKVFTKAQHQHGKSSAESVRAANKRLFKRFRAVEEDLQKISAKTGAKYTPWRSSQ